MMKDLIIKASLVTIFVMILLFVVFTGKDTPDFPGNKSTLYNEKGAKVTLDAEIGNVIIVSYFQTWCGECRSELPELRALQKAVGGEMVLKVILISDEGWDRLSVCKHSANTSFPIYQSEKSLRQIGIKRFPTTYLLDKRGNIVTAKVEDVQWNTPDIQQKILALNK